GTAFGLAPARPFTSACSPTTSTFRPARVIPGARSRKVRPDSSWKRYDKDDGTSAGRHARTHPGLSRPQRPERHESARRPAHAGRVGPSLLPHPASRRYYDRPLALPDPVRSDEAAVRERRHADGENAGPDSGSPGPRG